MTIEIEHLKPNDKILIFDRIFNVKNLIYDNIFIKLICCSNKDPHKEFTIQRKIGSTIIKIKD